MNRAHGFDRRSNGGVNGVIDKIDEPELRGTLSGQILTDKENASSIAEPDELRQPERAHPREVPLGQASGRQQRPGRCQPEVSDEADLDGRRSDPAVVRREGLSPQPRYPGQRLVPASEVAHVAAGRTSLPARKRPGDRIGATVEM